MNIVITKIKELENIKMLSKHNQIVNGIINTINGDLISSSDKLPTINEMEEGLGFARKTIVRAYNDLKSRGIIESRGRQGYYIISKSTEIESKIALVLYGFQTFQEIFYNTFRETVGDNYQVDIYFHHNNPKVFENIINTIQSKYTYFVIAPIEGKQFKSLMNRFPKDNLLIVDRASYLDFPHVVQYFEEPLIRELKEINHLVKKYKTFTLFYRENADFPVGIKKGFKKFIEQEKISGRVEQKYKSGSVEKGNLYFIINDTELWELLKDAQSKNLEIGKDIGIISHNDTPVKELLFGGISVFSTNFKRMAEIASLFIHKNGELKIVVDSKIIQRKSL